MCNVHMCKISIEANSALQHCKDLFQILTNDQLKPGKYISLGLWLKSVTVSRKIISVLNKLGHSISYPVAELLETELACEILAQES